MKWIIKITCIFMFCMGFVPILEANNAFGYDVYRGLDGKVLCIKGIDGRDLVYAGTENGLYVMDGEVWQRAVFPQGTFRVKSIDLREGGIIVSASGSVYEGRFPASGFNERDISWKRILGRTDIEKVIALPLEGFLAWSPGELFCVREGGWKRIGPSLAAGEIDGVALSGKNIFLVSGKQVYFSQDEGARWLKLPLSMDSHLSEEDDIVYSEEEEDFFGSGKEVISSDSAGCAVLSKRGVFIISGEGELLRKIDTSGLPSREVRCLQYDSGKLFASTDKKVFIYNDQKKVWENLFEKPFASDISFLEVAADSKGVRWLYFGGGRSLYRVRVDSYIKEVKRSFSAEKGVSVRCVQEMAIEYAEVSPEKIKRWRTGARWKALLPRLSVNFSESRDENIEIYKSSSTSYVIEGPPEFGNDWGVDLTWDLSDLVWNDAQTSIDVRSKLMVQLREDILEEVTRLYFERKRLLFEIENMEAGNIEEEKYASRLLEKRLKVEEITAYIDALTGGEFSRALTSN